MTETLFILFLVIHFLADFALQTHEQATKKSSSNRYLAYHVGTYSIIWTLFIFAASSNPIIGFMFGLITFISHYATDYFTSRLSKKFFDKNDFHNGFVVIGFDQILHYIQLIYTYKLCLLL
jgi:hypothetical protein